jgi:hypothetical protein
VVLLHVYQPAHNHGHGGAKSARRVYGEGDARGVEPQQDAPPGGETSRLPQAPWLSAKTLNPFIRFIR